ncbi:golgin subfamily A member 6-like protein 2 [Rosa chinensis]|uniref:golgin subfamily A member 6-like protein 2 n=1 Tax=Rosa chinensis TaxID=74649 RepID=UPI000D095F42|nr:golgin subfamily A member 6-like protein 2 [Rosa chinensis]
MGAGEAVAEAGKGSRGGGGESGEESSGLEAGAGEDSSGTSEGGEARSGFGSAGGGETIGVGARRSGALGGEEDEGAMGWEEDVAETSGQREEERGGESKVRSREDVGSDRGRGIGPWEWAKEEKEETGVAEAYGKIVS